MLRRRHGYRIRPLSRRVIPALLVAAILLLPSPSWSHDRARESSLTGTMTAFAGGITVVVTNAGTDAFNYFWIRMVTSVHHTGASIDRGGGCGPGPDANTVKCGVSYDGFLPGQTYTVTIMTDAPYPPNGGAQLFTGPGTNGPLIPAGTATGPPAAPRLPPCICRSLEVGIVPYSLKLVDPNGPDLRMHFQLHWSLNCSEGSQNSCNG